MRFSYQIGKFLGAPINLHVSVALAFVYFMLTRSYLDGAIMATCFLLLMLIHEMGHAWFVKKYGHELIEIKLFPIHGHCSYRYDSRFEPETLIYAGGLIAQILVLILFLALVVLLDFLGLFSILRSIEPATNVFTKLNVFIIIFNSLPFPGLDGFYLWKRLYGILTGNFRKLKRLIKNNRQNKREKQESPEKIVQFAIEKAKRMK